MNAIEIFIDESGDLGFGPKSSHHYVVVYIIPESPEMLQKRYSKSELKFARDRKSVFKELSNCSMKIGFVVIKAVKESLRNQQGALYNYLTVNYVVDNILSYLKTI